MKLAVGFYTLVLHSGPATRETDIILRNGVILRREHARKRIHPVDMLAAVATSVAAPLVHSSDANNNAWNNSEIQPRDFYVVGFRRIIVAFAKCGATSLKLNVTSLPSVKNSCILEFLSQKILQNEEPTSHSSQVEFRDVLR